MSEFKPTDLKSANTFATAAAEQNKDKRSATGSLTTSLMADPNPYGQITTYGIGDILSGMTLYKEKGATLNTFNDQLSTQLENLRGDFKVLKFQEDSRLNPYDAFEGTASKTFGFGGGVASTTVSTAQAEAGVTSGNVADGQAPSDIPKGPFPLRIVRRPGGKGYVAVKSDVAPVTLSENQVARLLASAGCARGDGIAFLIAVTKRESNLVCNVAGVDKNGGMGVGLWQITDFWPKVRGDGKLYQAEDMTDPWTNVMDCMRISKNGTFMAPWNLSGQWSRQDGSHLRGVDIEYGRRVAREAGVY